LIDIKIDITVTSIVAKDQTDLALPSISIFKENIIPIAKNINPILHMNLKITPVEFVDVFLDCR
jgi:dTDP-glucose pyrophosphorylase